MSWHRDLHAVRFGWWCCPPIQSPCPDPARTSGNHPSIINHHLSHFFPACSIFFYRQESMSNFFWDFQRDKECSRHFKHFWYFLLVQFGTVQVKISAASCTDIYLSLATASTMSAWVRTGARLVIQFSPVIQISKPWWNPEVLAKGFPVNLLSTASKVCLVFRNSSAFSITSEAESLG